MYENLVTDKIICIPINFKYFYPFLQHLMAVWCQAFYMLAQKKKK